VSASVREGGGYIRIWSSWLLHYKNRKMRDFVLQIWYTVEQWFSNSALQCTGGSKEVARCAANIMKVYFKNEKEPICIEIFIYGLKYINIFLILYTKCARKCLYVLQCTVNQRSLRTTTVECQTACSTDGKTGQDRANCKLFLMNYFRLMILIWKMVQLTRTGVTMSYRNCIHDKYY
jgi:hypothetical protein